MPLPGWKTGAAQSPPPAPRPDAAQCDRFSPARVCGVRAPAVTSLTFAGLCANQALAMACIRASTARQSASARPRDAAGAGLTATPPQGRDRERCESSSHHHCLCSSAPRSNGSLAQQHYACARRCATDVRGHVRRTRTYPPSPRANAPNFDSARIRFDDIQSAMFDRPLHATSPKSTARSVGVM